MVFTDSGPAPQHATVRPGPLRLVLENKTAHRVLPMVERMTARFGELVHRRQPYLTAKRVMSTQTFRDLYRGEALEGDQRLKVLSLTVLFTDLKGSTEMYERVGDLIAYDLVRAHFKVLGERVKRHGGAVVKTIGDAVMATFPTPERGFAAAVDMREAMQRFNEQQKREDLIVKIGLHEGLCLAVVLNERLDYFGQTMNIAARVQRLATEKSIFTTEPVVEHAGVKGILAERKVVPIPQKASLKGISEQLTVYEIP